MKRLKDGSYNASYMYTNLVYALCYCLMSNLITISDYLDISEKDRPSCVYDGKSVLRVVRDITFSSEKRYVIHCDIGDGQRVRFGAKYPGELLNIASK